MSQTQTLDIKGTWRQLTSEYTPAGDG